MIESELSRPVKVKSIMEEPYVIEADPSELAALAQRFGLSEVKHLRAELRVTPKSSDILAEGPIAAAWLQPCAVSGDDIAVSLSDILHLRFIKSRLYSPDEEVELEADECDEIEYEGDSFDLGEAVAQSLGLAIDPYATGPNADKIRKEKGIVVEGEQDGPLAQLLKGLQKN